MADIVKVYGLKELNDVLLSLPRDIQTRAVKKALYEAAKIVKRAVIGKISMYGLIDTGNMIKSVAIGRGKGRQRDQITVIVGMKRSNMRQRTRRVKLQRLFGHRQSVSSLNRQLRKLGLLFAYYAIPLENGFMLKIGKKTMYIPGYHFFERAWNESRIQALMMFERVLRKEMEPVIRNRARYNHRNAA